MVNSRTSHCCKLRKLLYGLNHVESSVDDVIRPTHTVTWSEQLKALHDLLIHIRQTKLTLKPSKCYFWMGYSNISSIGHVLGQGGLQTEFKKVERIVNAHNPKTKKEV